ncbi:hypothetical protein [Sphaerisporangium dianthi]|uniref:DUF402 domain-containing protein n=1 Tax=Sphaerisporangium dianthi TaxID=1436120 RepID=A0ABV9CFC5_9ACTN
MNPAEWALLRSRLVLGQALQGTVLPIPWPAGVTGIFVDLGLPVIGFVDVLLLPDDPDCWPTTGTVTDFEIWWIDERPQIRLKPVDAAYLRDDYDAWATKIPRRRVTPALVSNLPLAEEAVRAWKSGW